MVEPIPMQSSVFHRVKGENNLALRRKNGTDAISKIRCTPLPGSALNVCECVCVCVCVCVCEVCV